MQAILRVGSFVVNGASARLFKQEECSLMFCGDSVKLPVRICRPGGWIGEGRMQAGVRVVPRSPNDGGPVLRPQGLVGKMERDLGSGSGG